MENFIQDLKPLELQGFSKCVQCYHKYASMEEISAVGFNDNSGNIYFALENGITIFSSFGDDCEYMIYDDEEEEEITFETYKSACEKLNIEGY
jgi:hypothetical protein